jgi:hypothetical protein
VPTVPDRFRVQFWSNPEVRINEWNVCTRRDTRLEMLFYARTSLKTCPSLQRSIVKGHRRGTCRREPARGKVRTWTPIMIYLNIVLAQHNNNTYWVQVSRTDVYKTIFRRSRHFLDRLVPVTKHVFFPKTSLSILFSFFNDEQFENNTFLLGLVCVLMYTCTRSPNIKW